MLALASYFLFHGLIWGGIRGPLRWCMALLAALFVCTVLATDGRAGHLVFFILLILLLFQYFRGKVYKAILLTLVLIPLLFAAAYNLSPHFQARLDHAIEDIQIFHKNQDTSVGLRFVRWRNSWEIIRQSPWLGSGTGGFTAAYQEVHQRLSPALPMIDNPHNQYLFVLTQWGILGLLLLLNIFFAQIRQAGLNADGRGRMQLAFSLFFLTIMLTESYLSVHGTGFLFSLLGAVLFKKERLDQPEMAARTEDIASSGSLAVREGGRAG